MIPCSEALEQLWEYLDATLETTDRALVEEHLDRCRRCCGELAFAEELRGFLATSDRDDLPADVQQRLERTMEELEP